LQKVVTSSWRDTPKEEEVGEIIDVEASDEQ